MLLFNVIINLFYYGNEGGGEGKFRAWLGHQGMVFSNFLAMDKLHAT